MIKSSRPKTPAKAKPRGTMKDLKPRNETAVKGGIAVNDTGYCGDTKARPKPTP